MTGPRRWMFYVVCLALLVPPAAGGETSCIVREGDTLFGISRKVQVPLAVLQSYNGIVDPDKIKPGMTIRIPDVHVVQKGETMFAIARAAGVPVKQLLATNGMEPETVIKPGDRVFLPAGAKVAASPVGTAGLPGKDSSSLSAASAASGAGRWPLAGKREPWAPLKGIIGVAIEGRRGDEIVSVTAGEVSFAGRYLNYGQVVIVTMVDGHHLMYAGNEELLVSKGDRVRPGMAIARLGVSPTDNRARLLFSVSGRTYEYVDPERYLGNG